MKIIFICSFRMSSFCEGLEGLLSTNPESTNPESTNLESSNPESTNHENIYQQDEQFGLENLTLGEVQSFDPFR